MFLHKHDLRGAQNYISSFVIKLLFLLLHHPDPLCGVRWCEALFHIIYVTVSKYISCTILSILRKIVYVHILKEFKLNHHDMDSKIVTFFLASEGWLKLTVNKE